MEQAVIVKFSYGLKSTKELFALEAELENAIESAGVGGFDGNEISADLSDGYLYMYGPDADVVYAAVEPILKATHFMKSAQVTLVYGELGEDVPRKILQIA